MSFAPRSQLLVIIDAAALQRLIAQNWIDRHSNVALRQKLAGCTSSKIDLPPGRETIAQRPG
jgi:hypothetical protein